jgi:Polyketide cyclase / dehydrase and lipid transport
LRLVIGSLIIFSIVILFLFALFPSDISVSRLIRINHSSDQVIRKIANLQDWKNWNEFIYSTDAKGNTGLMKDGSDSVSIHKTDFTVERIKSLQDTILTRWQHGNDSFTGNFVGTPQTSDQTILEWTLYFHVKWYPWDKLASMFYDKQLGPVMEKSLLNLQKEMDQPQ